MRLLLLLVAASTVLACRMTSPRQAQVLSLRVAGFVKASGIT